MSLIILSLLIICSNFAKSLAIRRDPPNLIPIDTTTVNDDSLTLEPTDIDILSENLFASPSVLNLKLQKSEAEVAYEDALVEVLLERIIDEALRKASSTSGSQSRAALDRTRESLTPSLSSFDRFDLSSSYNQGLQAMQGRNLDRDRDLLSQYSYEEMNDDESYLNFNDEQDIIDEAISMATARANRRVRAAGFGKTRRRSQRRPSYSRQRMSGYSRKVGSRAEYLRRLRRSLS